MLSMIIPICLVVFSGAIYNVSAKSVPNDANPFLSLGVTYFFSGLICIVAFLLGSDKVFGEEILKINWASIVLAAAVVAVEAGYVVAYRKKWEMSVFHLIMTIFLSLSLFFVGIIIYNDIVSIKKIIGFGICLIGFVLLNKKRDKR